MTRRYAHLIAVAMLVTVTRASAKSELDCQSRDLSEPPDHI